MKAVCPNSPDHDVFVTTAHVMEEWVVNRDGSWRETLQSLEVTHSPDAGNTWTCTFCGSKAEVTE